jgi:flagellar L-ring protein precursor FlgH
MKRTFPRSRFNWGLMLVGVFMLNGCIEPTSIVKEPKTAKAVPINNVENNNGAIYNAKSYRAMFADRRPQFVGDILTIKITENTTANKANSNTLSSNNKTDASVAAFFGHPKNDATFTANGKRSYDDSTAANMSNVFNGTITATVIEVLPNGNLMVSGEKQLAFDKGGEFVRISGVVNPDTVTQGNVVSSTSIADARIEYRTNSTMDPAEFLSKFARFFLSMGF